MAGPLEIAEKLAENLKEADRDIVVAVTAEGTSTDNLLYLGTIPYREMPRYMASADVGLCIYEPIDFFKRFFFSPLKLYDYMASGLPVVGSDVGQIKLVIEESRSGLLTDTTIDDLVKKILYLKNNRTEAVELGKNGRKAIVEKYNWKNVTKRLEEILLEQIKDKKRLSIPEEKTEWLYKLNESELRERVLVLAERNKKLAEKLVGKERLLEKKELLLVENSRQLEERERYIGTLLGSRSWKITAPLRKTIGMLKK